MEIKINRLILENFKNHQHLELEPWGRSMRICGNNATGKTSIYDGFTWLLFGKDSAGNGEKNIEIKPVDTDGNVKDHQAITSVEAELLADGETVTLKRTYREIWATRRGSGEPVFDGNTSDYFVDGVPCKKNPFQVCRLGRPLQRLQFHKFLLGKRIQGASGTADRAGVQGRQKLYAECPLHGHFRNQSHV